MVIVEDDHLQLERLQIVLGSEPDIKIKGAYTSPDEAFDAIGLDNPDILLTDINMPGMGGINLIKKTKQIAPDIDIMAFTIHDDMDTVFSAIKAGAASYVLKGASSNELITALKELNRGGAPMSPTIARAIIKEFQGADEAPPVVLTGKERIVLLEAENGLAYKEIADKLDISIHTVHTHVKKIFEKLRARNKTEAVAKARQKGLL